MNNNLLNYEIKWNTSSDNKYQIIRKIRSGKHYDVFEGNNTESNEKCCIKVIKQCDTNMNRIEREIKVLKHLHKNVNAKNIVKLIDLVHNEKTNTFFLIMEYEKGINFNNIYPNLTDYDIKYYLFELLKTLDYTHSMGVMHRDIKPQHLVVDHENKKLTIIDWGSAEFFNSKGLYNVKTGARYKSPELLINFQYYDSSVEMWSLGCLLAGILFKKEPFFTGWDNYDLLIKITKVLGTEDLFNFLYKYQLKLPKELDEVLTRQSYPKQVWTKFLNNDNKHLVNDAALDFLSKLLRYDFKERIKAKEALQHCYFSSVVCNNVMLLIGIKLRACEQLRDVTIYCQ